MCFVPTFENDYKVTQKEEIRKFEHVVLNPPGYQLRYVNSEDTHLRHILLGRVKA
jgi:tRNA1(Val) A37 N6-methylase TrmN6